MAITEEQRHQLYQRLQEVLGVEQASTLMEHLPPVGWADVATKRDLDAQSAATSRELEAVRAEIAGLASSLRSEVAAGDGSLRSEIAHQGELLRAEMAHGFEASGLRLDAAISDVRAAGHRAHRNLAVTMMATNTTLLGIALAAFKLL